MFIPRRLAKHVHDLARCSTGEVATAWRSGRIAVEPPRSGEEPPVGLDALVYEEDRVLLDGHLLVQSETHFYGVLNKPLATLCVPRDPRGKGDLSRWLSEMPAGTFAVGRLDRDTTGALLLTTDGDLANTLLRPERHAKKLYELKVSVALSATDPRLEALTCGIDVGPYFAKALSVELKRVALRQSELWLTLDEGRHRQIRRMCRTVGLPLVALHRRSIGPINVEGLELGKWRSLNLLQVATLWQLSGGRHRLARDKVRSLAARAARFRHAGTPDGRLERWLSRSDAVGLVGLSTALA